MGECECLAGCPFFNEKMANMPATAEVIKKRFCKSDYTKCARYMVKDALGKEKVPLNLLPNQKEEAEALISAEMNA